MKWKLLKLGDQNENIPKLRGQKWTLGERKEELRFGEIAKSIAPCNLFSMIEIWKWKS